MKYLYTAVITPQENASGFFARVPDLPGCITTGKDLWETIDMITDAASIWLVNAEEHHMDDIHHPTPQEALPQPDNAVLTILQIDTDAYRVSLR